MNIVIINSSIRAYLLAECFVFKKWGKNAVFARTLHLHKGEIGQFWAFLDTKNQILALS